MLSTTDKNGGNGMQSDKGRRKTWVAVSILAALIVLFGVIFIVTKPSLTKGVKTINVQVIHGDQSVRNFTINTEAEFLRQALEEENLVSGTESEYGLYLLTVDDETADESKQEWWCVSQDGQMCNYGVDEQPIIDSESYEITLKTGWD